MAANKLNLKGLIRTMREDLLEAAPGAFLGLEEEVLRRYDVSRPTLRQAARVLEYEQLLDVKPGKSVRGYFYAPHQWRWADAPDGQRRPADV